MLDKLNRLNKLNKLNKLSITLILLVFIQSCDSESDTESDQSILSEYQFELVAQLTNQCGQKVAFDQLEIHLQDDNWALIEKYTADINGIVNFTTDQENINYTIVAKSQQGSDEEGLDIVSYYHANTTTAASYEATYDNAIDNTSCECITQDIQVQHRSFATIDSITISFDYQSYDIIDTQNTYLNDAKICRVIDGEWPVQSIAIRGVDVNGNMIGAASVFDSVESNSDNLFQTAAIEVAENSILPEVHQAFTIMQLIDDREHFKTEVEESSTESLVFNTHAYISESIYSSNANYTFDSFESIFGQAAFTSHHQIKSSVYSEAVSATASTNKPDIDNVTFSELADDGSYDYSTVSNYPLVEIAFDYELSIDNSNEIMPITWTMYGPNQGILASSVQLEGYENLINADTYIHSTDIKIIRSKNTDTYEDYINYYQGNTNSDFSDDLYYFQLTLLL